MKKLTDKEKVRQDIKSYERNKKLKRLSSLGVAASAGAAAAGGYKKNPALAAAGIGGSFLSGFARAKARNEERASLGRIKRFYDLREKTAVLGGATEAATALAGLVVPGMEGGMSHMISHALQYGHIPELIASTAGAMAPLAMDLAFVPTIADYVGKETRKHTYIAAKDVLGKPLTPQEKIYRAKSQKGVAAKEIAKNMSPGVRKGFMNWWNKVFHSYKATGGQIGEYAGAGLKELNKYSPSLANSALGALQNDQGLKRFEKQVKLRAARYQQAANIVDQTIDEIPGLRPILRATGKSGQNIMADLLENPRTAKLMAEKLRTKVVQGVRGGKAGLAALGVAGIGAALGSYRQRHPLAKDELPAQITNFMQRKMANTLANPMMPTKNVAAAQPPVSSPPIMANVGTPNI